MLEITTEKANLVFNPIDQEASIMMKNEKLSISLSIAAITYYQTPKSVDHAIEEVDELMYNTKNTGKN